FNVLSSLASLRLPRMSSWRVCWCRKILVFSGWSDALVLGLDQILCGYVKENASAEEISATRKIAQGLVQSVICQVNRTSARAAGNSHSQGDAGTLWRGPSVSHHLQVLALSSYRPLFPSGSGGNGSAAFAGDVFIVNPAVRLL